MPPLPHTHHSHPARAEHTLVLPQDAQGSTVAELRKGGELRGHWGMTCGTLEGFDFHKMQALHVCTAWAPHAHDVRTAWTLYLHIACMYACTLHISVTQTAAAYIMLVDRALVAGK